LIDAELKQGVSEIVLTPHYYGQKFSPRQFLEKRQESFNKISDRLNGIKIRLGAEVYFDEMKVASNKELCALAIEGTKYVLFELPFANTWSEKLLFRLRRFIVETGYTPVIAHLERYPATRKNPAYLSALTDIGCLLQVNTRSFSFKGTKNLVFTMLKKGCVSCIGTDSHNLKDRTPDLAETKKIIEEAGEGARLEQVFATMRKILDGEKVLPPTYQPIKKFFKKYF
jgi:protein-tyrosine phosphatase